jgi:hypothetical protein
LHKSPNGKIRGSNCILFGLVLESVVDLEYNMVYNSTVEIGISGRKLK